MSGLFGSPPQIFDFPCNERVRMMLRLECLGQRLHDLLALPSAAAHEAWLGCHFELYDLLSTRSDVKNELLQELERQRQTLGRFEGKPGVAPDRLARVLNELTQTYNQLSDVPMRLGAHLPEYEFLNALKGRTGIPAGSCSFDLPALHVWLKRPVEDRIALMSSWLAHV
ncbi:MAG: cell division protein ZapD, partial [Burkholderiaceae bacterium]